MSTHSVGGQPPLDPSADTVAEQAAEWIVRLTADDETEREQAHAGFEAWKQRDPRHAQEAERMQGFLQHVQGVREATGNPKAARAALNAAFSVKPKRGKAKGVGIALVIALALAVPAWLTLQAYPVAYLAADLRTSTGQWQTETLSDGTRITLNSASAVNLRYDERRRAVELVSGEILVEVAKDAARPFLVETTHGSIRALGTRFVVRRLDIAAGDATDLTMIESKVSVQTAAQRAADSPDATIVSAGERVRITAQGLGRVEPVDARSVSDAWKFHRLVVQGQPLPDVLDELNRQRPGFIQFDRAQLESIKVSAVLPLDDTDRALQLLVTNFPNLRVRTLTPYLVMVDISPEK